MGASQHMVTLLQRHPGAVHDEGLDQYHHLAGIVRPATRFGQRQWHMVAGAAFAAAGTAET
ncbi:hypothetical protein D3C78_1791220 [compost metagenome]